MTRVVRTGITIPKKLLKRLDEFMNSLGIKSRSKIISEALRNYLNERSVLLKKTGKMIGTILLVYDHERGETVNKILSAEHEYLQEIRSTLHIHLTHDKCLEIIAIEGEAEKLRRLVSSLENISGVEIVRCLFFEVT